MKTTVYLSAFVFAAAISLIGCGDPLLDDLNSNIEVGSGDLSIAENYEQAAGMFLTAQQKMHDVGASNGAHVYQVQFNIHIDNYSGYMAGTQNFSGNLPSTYRYFAQYCDGPKASFFNVAQAALPVMRSAADLNLREIGAMCNIMYCFSALELSDVYGPFPWTDYKNDVQEPPVTYEPMDQIYDSLFVNLKDAGKILKEFTSTSEEHQDTINQILAQYDKICGDVKTWEQFSNSIRLRMAMRMSNVNPDRAKTEAQSAIDDGLIEKSIEYNTMVNNGTNHPLAFISILWNDTRINASLENIMKRLKVPFMDKIFEKIAMPYATKTEKRRGKHNKTLWESARESNSHLGTIITNTPNFQVSQVLSQISRSPFSNSPSVTFCKPRQPFDGISADRSIQTI